MIASPSSDWIEQRIAAFLVSGEPAPEHARAIAAALRVLPLMYDWSALAAIRPDGELLWVDYDPPRGVRPIADALTRHIVLFQGSKRHPAVPGLFPERLDDAEDCPACAGTGMVRIDGRDFPNVVCRCGGSGWLPRT